MVVPIQWSSFFVLLVLTAVVFLAVVVAVVAFIIHLAFQLLKL
jgi:hypothetical protein